MEDFWKQIKQYRRLLLWSLGSSAIPIASYFLSMAPPIEIGTKAVVALTAIAEMFAVILAFLYIKNMSLKKAQKLFTIGFGLFIIFAMAYLFAFSSLTFTTPHNEEKIIVERYMRGFECTTRIESKYSDLCPNLPREIINKFNYIPDKIWTRSSIDQASLVLIGIWTCLFCTIAFSFAGFVNFQSSRQRK